jgi:hypothetical protein
LESLQAFAAHHTPMLHQHEAHAGSHYYPQKQEGDGFGICAKVLHIVFDETSVAKLSNVGLATFISFQKNLGGSGKVCISFLND